MTAKKVPAKKTLKNFTEKVAKKVTHKKVKATTPEKITNGAAAPVATVTDARIQGNIISGDQSEGIVIAPAKKYDLDPSRLVSLIPAIRDAWNEVRGRGDAVFDECAPPFRETLLAHALSVFNTSAVLQGDTNLARFEQKLAAIKSKHLKVKGD